MLFILSLLILSLLFFAFSLPAIETMLSFFVGTEILFYIFGKMGLPIALSYIISMFLSLGGIFIFAKKRKCEKNKKGECVCSKLKNSDIQSIIFFLISFVSLYLLSVSWADFIALGERLRDYAILSSVIDSPINLKEPWFAGFELNYYGFWYRMGSMLSFLFNYTHWETYHILVSVNTALYVTFIFIILRKYLKFNFVSSLLLTLLVFPGSNFNGVKFFFSFDDYNWWGPSRVIEGAITEFPMWSFILGDAHPHFLNLLLFPFVISFILFFDVLSWGTREKAYFTFLILLFPLCILLNSNPWDLPVYGMLFVVMIAYILGVIFVHHKSLKLSECKTLTPKKLGVCVLFLGLSFISLFLSSRNISPTNTPVDIVKAPIARTIMAEFLDAFLLPTLFIFIGNLFLFEKKYRASFFFITLLALFLQPFLFSIDLTKSLAVLPLIIIFIYNMIRVIREAKDFDIENISWRNRVVFEAIGIAVLIIWIVPEFLFLNDSYGAGNERMNTIFKLYSVGWALSYIFAFYLLKRNIEKFNLKNALVYCGTGCLLIVFSLCFFKLISIRKIDHSGISSCAEIKEGLGEVNKMYPGAKQTIAEFRKYPKGIVMESTKGAYNYASHVATIADKDSYLGWINHVGLLYKKDNENQERMRRENDIRVFYTNFSCEQRKNYMSENNISYVVMGPLEREEFGENINNDFSCLKNIIQYDNYVIYQLGD